MQSPQPKKIAYRNRWWPRLLQSLGRRFLSARGFVRLEHFLDSRSESRYQFKRLHEFGPNRGRAIDIGANLGVFSFALAKLYDSVEAFEINPRLIEPLKKAVSQNVTVHAFGLSDKHGEGTMFVPKHRGKSLVGWGSLEEISSATVSEIEKVAVPIATLDSYQFSDVTFIKIDVEGHEVQNPSGSR